MVRSVNEWDCGARSVLDTGRYAIDTFTAPGGIRAEEELFDRFCQSEGDRVLSLWTQSRCLVTTPAAARATGFQAAARASNLRGWPVILRRSGGATVFHAPDVLCVTLIVEGSTDRPSIDSAYIHFAALLKDALALLGVKATTGEAPGAPCDGRFNILVNARKLAGTAMRTRASGARLCLLAHAAFLIGERFADGLAAVEKFEREIGLSSTYPADRSVSLTDLVGPSGSARFPAALERAFSLSPAMA